ncbi:DUF4886 domain-containing protein [Parapedobacter sp. 2B3]|uniref:DUF4886 domain-containing protein n=1 Tax=Parapedobacter sp. 2B3 TaxID=3342381 RepID=UPI0035B62D2B
MFHIIRFSLVIGLFVGNCCLANAGGQRDTLKVLAIGNSFSQDAVEQYLHELAAVAGKPIVIANMYIGGAPLSLHWRNVQTDSAAYSYRKIDVDGVKTTKEGVSIRTALQDEQWDYVSLQQASPLSGQFDSYVAPLTALHHYFDSATAGRAQYIWHQTWAYAANSTHSGFANYHNDQHEMYEAIMEASAKAAELVPIDLLVPCGTAIQHARTSFIGDNLTRDGYHLDLHIGRFIAACTWFEALFGQQAPVDRYRPEGVSVAQAEVAQRAAHAALLQPFSVTQGASPRRPNIVLIISDDHAFQAIGAYGHGLVETPNMDRIAHGGARFGGAYVTNSICGPSRATLLTGKYSHKNGFKDNETSTFDHGQELFVKGLQNMGYQTAWIGKQHLGDSPQGFDYYSILPGQGAYYNPDFINTGGQREHVEGYVTNIITDKAETWLDGRDRGEPFCLIIGHKATHRTWLPDTVDFGRYDHMDFPLPETFYDDYAGRQAAAIQEMSIASDIRMGYDLKMEPVADADREGAIKRMNTEQRQKFDAYYQPIFADFNARSLTGHALAEWKYQRYMRDYLSTAASLDRNIGRILDYLDANGLAGNTLVIYLSDQGFYLGEHGWFDKRFMYEESFRTPMLARLPGTIEPGSVVNGFVVNTDIAPTVLQLAGADIPAAIQGISMLPLFHHPDTTIREAIYYHYYENGEHAVSPHFGVRNERYKLIRFYKRVDAWELFDLKEDPNELNNLYGKKGYEAITAEMRQLLQSQIEKFEDREAAALLAAVGRD